MLKYLAFLSFVVLLSTSCATVQPPKVTYDTIEQNSGRCYNVQFPEEAKLINTKVELPQKDEPTSFENTYLNVGKYRVMISHGQIEGGHMRSGFEVSTKAGMEGIDLIFDSRTPREGDYATFMIGTYYDKGNMIYVSKILAYGVRRKSVLNIVTYAKASEFDFGNSSSTYSDLMSFTKSVYDNLSIKCK